MFLIATKKNAQFFNKLVPLTKMPTRFELHESQFGKKKKINRTQRQIWSS